jgi:diaminopimelate epimerase
MNGVGNDFVIFDARKSPISLTSEQITKISDRKNIGCDQLIIMKSSSEADCLMEIYNSDGSMSGACGNATRCVASLIEKDEVKIKTAAGILECKRSGDLISVNMGKPKLTGDVSLHGFDFTCVDMGNPHAVTFINDKISDEKFFDVGPKVECDKFFPNKTNVEFVRILSDDLVEVRVFERGAGETLACGSGACAVAVAAIAKGLVKSKKITTRFKGGDLQIDWSDDFVIMTGGFEKIFNGTIDEKFFS